jgi:signal transduction histidine kinase
MVLHRRISGVTALVVVVLLLVPALAWLQYRWVGQVSEAERERMQRTLRTAAAQFATAFDSELSRAVVGLQVEGAVARDGNWASYAERYTTWTERTTDPRLVREVLLVDAGAAPAAAPGATAPGTRPARRAERPVTPDQLRVRRWNNDQRTFEPVEWSAELEPFRAALAEHFGDVPVMRGQANGRFRREGMVSFTVSDPYTLVSPATVFDFPADRKSPPRIDILGFTLIRLDQAYVRETMVPALAARHFHGEDGTEDYRIAVTDRHDTSRVIWESELGAAAAIGSSPDVEAAFMSARPDQVFMIARSRGNAAPPPPGAGPDERIAISVLQDRRSQADGAPTAPPPPAPPAPPVSRVTGFGGGFEGRWRVAAVHRAGSLEAAVAALRTRNLMLSSGILLLLTAAIGLIVVSSRRAQTLARQQMEFVAAVSHELRTPVSVIGTAASNLADGVVSDPARVRKYGETIQGEARRLAETVERVLQLAGIAAGSAARSRAPVSVAEIVQQSVAACRSEIDARGVTLELNLPDDLPPVQGDAGALRSAVQNLISNAVKYGGDARWVRVTAAPSPGLKPRRSNNAGPGTVGGDGTSVPSPTTAPAPASRPTHVAITVSDRGLGVPAEDRKHIFEPFYRGREAVSRQIQGSGLGLNLVARIAEAHGGTVELTSEPGKGSTFTLLLPAAPGTPEGVGLGLVPSGADAK